MNEWIKLLRDTNIARWSAGGGMSASSSLYFEPTHSDKTKLYGSIKRYASDSMGRKVSGWFGSEEQYYKNEKIFHLIDEKIFLLISNIKPIRFISKDEQTTGVWEQEIIIEINVDDFCLVS